LNKINGEEGWWKKKKIFFFKGGGYIKKFLLLICLPGALSSPILFRVPAEKAGLSQLLIKPKLER
jgi:hypothetical protein